MQHRGYNNTISSNGNSTAQKFGYNGVELEESLGLDLMEMDERSYDPAIARWTSIDPITHFSNSTYNAFDNNPVFWADPSGADAVYNWDDGKYYDNGKEVSFAEAMGSYGLNTDGSEANNNDDCKKNPEKCKKKSKKKEVKDMSAGEFYAMAYNGYGRTAFLNGNDPYNPTESDMAQSDKERDEAALDFALMIVPISKVLKILKLGKYTRTAYHKALDVLKKSGDDLLANGKTYEQVVKVLSPARNMLKATIRKSDSWIGRKIAETRNLYKYGNKLGPQLDNIARKYTKNGVTNWKAIYDNIWKTSKTFDKIK